MFRTKRGLLPNGWLHKGLNKKGQSKIVVPKRLASPKVYFAIFEAKFGAVEHDVINGWRVSPHNRCNLIIWPLLICGGFGGATQPLPKDGGAE